MNSVPQRRYNLRRVFRIGIAIFALFIPVIANVICWWMDAGVDSTVIIASSRGGDSKVHFLNPRLDVAYCLEDLSGPEPLGFQIPKSPEVIRICVVGESAVQGFPYPSELSFPRQLECILSRQWPDKRVEVLNAGIVGVSSLAIADLVSQLSAAQLDALVVYAGHNEFYGVGGVATNAPGSANSIALRKFRLGQILTSFRSKSADDTFNNDGRMLLEKLPADFRIAFSNPLVQNAASNLDRNLIRIINHCRSNQLPLLLCTTVCNLRDMSPHLLDEPKDPESAQARIRLFLQKEEFASALSEADQSLKLQPDSAVLHFRRAQALNALGDLEESNREYSLSRDLDPCRYRAPDLFRQKILALRDKLPPSSAVLDLVPVFDEKAEDSVPGFDLFLEHVHLNLAGHWLVAKSIAGALAQDCLRRPFDTEKIPSEQERDEYLNVIGPDQFSGLYLALSLQESPPLNSAIDNDQHAREIRHLMQSAIESMPAHEMQLFMRLPNQTKIDDACDGIGRLLLQQSKPLEAEIYFKRSIRRRPWLPNGYVFAAVCRHLQNDQKGAQELLSLSEHTAFPESVQLLNDKERLKGRIRRAEN